nr:hypothetical protein [Streptomyces sp. MNU77]
MRLEPQNGWSVNEPNRLNSLLAQLESIRETFVSSRPAGRGISTAALIVLAGPPVFP